MRGKKRISSRRKKSPYDTKKITLYILGLVIIIAIYGYLAKASHKQNTNPTPTETQSYEFRKDGELKFISQEGNIFHSIDIEIADSEATRTLGLMNRKSMFNNQGMLFIYNSPHLVTMWMKNTHIPLDMIFIKEDKTISEIKPNTTPFDEKHLTSREPVQYVIEVTAGFAESYGIKPGQRVEW